MVYSVKMLFVQHRSSQTQTKKPSYKTFRKRAIIHLRIVDYAVYTVRSGAGLMLRFFALFSFTIMVFTIGVNQKNMTRICKTFWSWAGQKGVRWSENNFWSAIRGRGYFLLPGWSWSQYSRKEILSDAGGRSSPGGHSDRSGVFYLRIIPTR